MIEDENLEELQNRLNKQLEKRIELQKKVDQGGRAGTRAKKELDALNLQIEATEKSIEVNKLLKDSNDEQSKGVNHLAEAFKNLNNAQTIAETQAKQFATKFQTGLTQAFDNIIDGTKSVGASLKELGKTLLREAVRMVIFRAIIAPFTAGFGGFLDKIGLPGKAMGGSVSKGRPYMVGEQGAELFVPGQSGSIIPNHKLGGGGVVINQNINFATGVQATVRNEVLGMLTLISQA